MLNWSVLFYSSIFGLGVRTRAPCRYLFAVQLQCYLCFYFEVSVNCPIWPPTHLAAIEGPEFVSLWPQISSKGTDAFSQVWWCLGVWTHHLAKNVDNFYNVHNYSIMIYEKAKPFTVRWLNEEMGLFLTHLDSQYIGDGDRRTGVQGHLCLCSEH